MSLYQVRNVVLLFSNPWNSNTPGSSRILKNITSLSSQIAYTDRITENITTLSSGTVTGNTLIQGLLYVPELSSDDSCLNRTSAYVPANATTQADLPPTNYNLIAIAPWVNSNCSRAFLTATKTDQLRAFIFYLPNNDTSQPPDGSDSVWDIYGNSVSSWAAKYHFPVFALPGNKGSEMMYELSQYSGNLTTVPNGANISAMYQPDPADYVRVWTELKIAAIPPILPVWAYVLIIIGVLIVFLSSASLLMHYIQKRRQASLRRRVMLGEIDLEALGISRVTVPPEHILQFPLFTYNYESPHGEPPKSPPASPLSPNWEASDEAALRMGREAAAKPVPPTDYQPMCHICEDDFESRVSVIRELPCGHIFHPECIDEFLSEISSLCPLCKKSMLPKGYCPKITYETVRRERATRRLRPRIIVPSDKDRPPHGKLKSLGSIFKKKKEEPTMQPLGPEIELQERGKKVNQARSRQRMRELAGLIDGESSDDGKPPWKRTFTKIFPWP